MEFGLQIASFIFLLFQAVGECNMDVDAIFALRVPYHTVPHCAVQWENSFNLGPCFIVGASQTNNNIFKYLSHL